jgi:hypothetical protein
MTGSAKQRKGMGFPSLTGTNRAVCVTVPAREGVRLTRGVHEALGLAWQRLGGGNGAASLEKWAGPGVL